MGFSDGFFATKTGEMQLRRDNGATGASYPDTLLEALLPPADRCLEAVLACNFAELVTLR